MRSSSSGLLLGSAVLCCVGLGQAHAQVQTQAQPEAPAAANPYLLACQQSADCNGHLTRATQLYKQELYADALAEYEAAYGLQPYPLILFNIARLHHKQNHLTEAVAFYQRYLDSRDTERLERTRQLLADALREQQASATPRPGPMKEDSVLASPPALPPPPQLSSPVVAPPPVASIAPPAALTPRRALPIYKQWWLWTVIGVTAVGTATAVGLAIYLHGPDVSGLPAKTLMIGSGAAGP